MARVGAHNIHAAMAAEHFAVCTAYVYRGFYFHFCFIEPGLEPARYARLAAVRFELDEDLVPHKHFDAMQTHLTGQIAQHLLPALQRDAKKSIRQGLVYDALDIWCFVLHNWYLGILNYVPQ